MSANLSLPIDLKTSHNITKCYNSHAFRIQVNYYVLRSKT